MTTIPVSQLKNYLQNSSKQNLADDILELFKKFPKVKEFYQSKLTGGDLELRDKYKKIIKNEFFPDRGFGKMRLSMARKAISDFRKLSSNNHLIADLMIYYVEMGVDFTLEYSDIDEPFYNSMESMYETAAKFVIDSKIEDDYLPRFQKIVSDTSDMGWGFHDMLGELYHQYFSKKLNPA
jgi:hypothetical protein